MKLSLDIDNITALFIAFGILFWYKGMYRIMDKFIPDELPNNLICALIGLLILYFNDSKLFEIAKKPGREKLKNNMY